MLLPVFLFIISHTTAKTCPSELHTSYPAPIAADGWSYGVAANELTNPRSLVFDSAGGLLVLESGRGVERLTFEDHGGSCLAVSGRTTVVDDASLNHGLALSHDGRTLYASNPHQVMAWGYNASSGSVYTSPEVIVSGMWNAMHSTRTVFVTSAGDLLVSRGSAANADPVALNMTSGHCQIRAFSSTANNQSYTSGKVVGWGLRNSVGIAEHPDTGIWSVENSVDNLQRDGVDVHNDNPAEELNYHGNVSSPRGSNHGYPLCYTLWGTQDFPNLGNLTTGDQFAATGAEGAGLSGTVSDSLCNALFTPPVLSFQAHTAPLDIVFDSSGENAYVSFHGSWNRDSPVGYAVGSIPFSNGRPVPAKNSTNGVTEIFRNANLAACPGQCFRPVGLAWDAAGRLWVASDATGEVFVLVKGADEWSSPNNKSAGTRVRGNLWAVALLVLFFAV